MVKDLYNDDDFADLDLDGWVIRNKLHDELFFDEENGWVEHNFTVYDDDEARTLNLPIEGCWITLREAVIWIARNNPMEGEPMAPPLKH